MHPNQSLWSNRAKHQTWNVISLHKAETSLLDYWSLHQTSHPQRLKGGFLSKFKGSVHSNYKNILALEIVLVLSVLVLSLDISASIQMRQKWTGMTLEHRNVSEHHKHPEMTLYDGGWLQFRSLTPPPPCKQIPSKYTSSKSFPNTVSVTLVVRSTLMFVQLFVLLMMCSSVVIFSFLSGHLKAQTHQTWLLHHHVTCVSATKLHMITPQRQQRISTRSTPTRGNNSPHQQAAVVCIYH